MVSQDAVGSWKVSSFSTFYVLYTLATALIHSLIHSPNLKEIIKLENPNIIMFHASELCKTNISN